MLNQSISFINQSNLLRTKFNVIFPAIYQNHTEIPVEVVKKYFTVLGLNVIIAANFLQEQISKNNTYKIVPASSI